MMMNSFIAQHMHIQKSEYKNLIYHFGVQIDTSLKCFFMVTLNCQHIKTSPNSIMLTPLVPSQLHDSIEGSAEDSILYY